MDSLDEFAMNNSEIFQTVEKSASSDKRRSSETSGRHDANGLPSAKTLRGGQSVIARGRHNNYGRASATPSMGSVASTGSEGRFGRSIGSTSPSSPRRVHSNKLTPGLKGDDEGSGRRRRSRTGSFGSNRSSSLSPQISRTDVR